MLLKSKFEEFDGIIVTVNNNLSLLPNYQKDLSASIKSYREASEKVGEFMRIGAENCNELLSLI